MRSFSHLIHLLIVFLLLKAGGSVLAFSSADANALASSFNSAFYVVNGTNGYYKDTQAGGVTYFWGQAEEIECALDAYEWTSNTTYLVMITNLLNGFIYYNGANWTGNMYNDDIMWAVLAFARGGRLTGRTNYINIAKSNFDACYARAWDTNLGGGLYWTTQKGSKNACVNGPGSIAASLLYQVYGDPGYYSKATNLYYWERAVLFDAGSGAISDAIETNGNINTWASTYNQGTFIGAADLLGQTNDANLAAQFTMMRMTSRGILPEYGIAGNNSGFNAIFLRWMTRFMKGRNLQAGYGPWLQLNAAAAWNLRRADNLSWCQWLHASPAGTNFYSWDCISSFEAMAAAAPTQSVPAMAVPRGEIGFWPLDATNGSVAADASGNINNGTVSGADWSGAGRFNGCLSFNGSNSTVQISSPVRNDFTIAFWVKTTQTAGTGQWYNGAGLVDGDVPFTQNDFGTALVGGKFAIGIGNPDTTLLSSSVINDGAWHHCAATRNLATGVMRVYVDGNLQSSGNGGRNTLGAGSQLLFGAIASGGGYFRGSLDEVRLFDRELGSNEVAGLYYSAVLPPMAAPLGLTATPGNQQVRLGWSEAPAGTSYAIKRALTSGGPYTTIATVAGTAYTDTTVVNNKTYFYVVSAVNAAGEGANSAETSASTSTLAAWFKANAITGLASGAAVSVWPDSSGNGCNAIQTVNANQPAYVAGAVNGMPAVRFNAANKTCLWFYRPVQDDMTIILVYQSTQGIGTGTDFYSGAGLVNGEVGGAVNDFGLSLNANGRVLAGTGNPDTSIYSNTGFNDGLPHVVTFRRTKSNGVIELFVDGARVAATAGTQSLTAPNQLVLGAQQSLNNYLAGDIAEVQLYSAALSETDRLAQERTLKCKYAVAGGAVPSAPAGLTGVAGNRRISLNWLLSPGALSYNLLRSTNGAMSYELAATGLTNSSFVDFNAANGKLNYYKLAAVNGCGPGTNSGVISVFLPLPALTMGVSAGAMDLSWPGWANDWRLLWATNLAPPAAWMPVTNMPWSNAGKFSVSIPMDSPLRFFRLSSP